MWIRILNWDTKLSRTRRWCEWVHWRSHLVCGFQLQVRYITWRACFFPRVAKRIPSAYQFFYALSYLLCINTTLFLCTTRCLRISSIGVCGVPFCEEVWQRVNEAASDWRTFVVFCASGSLFFLIDKNWRRKSTLELIWDLISASLVAIWWLL